MEEWRTVEIKGDTWHYEVSSKGRVRNVETGRILKQRVRKSKQKDNDYLVVTLCRNSKKKDFYVHRLVAFAYILNDNPTVKTQVNHIDENKLNNCVENLEWVTPKQNIHHGTLQERKSKASGKRVRCIETGIVYDSIRQAERETGIPNARIGEVCRGKLKSYGGYTWEYVD